MITEEMTAYALERGWAMRQEWFESYLDEDYIEHREFSIVLLERDEVQPDGEFISYTYAIPERVLLPEYLETVLDLADRAWHLFRRQGQHQRADTRQALIQQLLGSTTVDTDRDRR